jgi:hypothetical protein
VVGLRQSEDGARRLVNHAQAVTSDMLHDEHCGEQATGMASLVRLMDRLMYWTLAMRAELAGR